MKRFPPVLRALALIAPVICLTAKIPAQPMLTFPADTVIAEGCGNPWELDTRLFGLNPTNEPFQLTWWKTKETYPTTGFSALIIDGRQYLPSANTGMVNLGGQDSVEVVFELYPNDMAPGDTMVYQVVVFNPEDSAGTAVVLTGMIVCPETTGIEETNHSTGFTLYPNPARGQVFFEYEGTGTGSRFDIYTYTGKQVHTLPAAEAGSPVAIDEWPAGAYIVCLADDARILARQILIITP
jgi:hypothetical protein